ncbi:hypothetical protein CONPUDRAFT_147499 [Coniophora puteana RWD-64-598 SS2]|uniref:Uncharacterized protein n=1 Tax=Coniophora puteana (strain RWD-64-598) TaxID=741705 RepID=A0A5M3M6E6_CONPW|nr:uncharacterized protein CONPUDRAFT_147499 [Coniophora puteana RWD-64-598 SS2]EIW74918.1 hypothetical protein CONPUDRAFT_147499 [Coniophora puteana RWD-64-598 SS2]
MLPTGAPVERRRDVGEDEVHMTSGVGMARHVFSIFSPAKLWSSSAPESRHQSAIRSRKVAHGLHEVRICAPFGPGSQTSARHRECPPNLDLILPNLLRFRNLRSLAFIHVPFSLLHLDGLRSLKHIGSSLFYRYRAASLPGDHLALRSTRPAPSQLLDIRDLSLVEDSHFKPIRVALGIPYIHSLASLIISDAPCAAAFLRVIARRSKSAKVQLEEGAFVAPDDLETWIHKAGDAVAQVDSLKVTMSNLSTSVLEMIGACCPRLKELEMDVSGGVAVDSESAIS